MKDNETQPIFLAKISSFEGATDAHGCFTQARVVPITSPDVVTAPYNILWIARGKLGDLKIDSLVVCARFENGSGIIICRADGEHTNVFPDGMTVDGTLTAATDVIAADKSLTGHTHAGVHGETSPPS